MAKQPAKIELDWTEVDSSNIQAVAFEERTKTLCVRFNSGTLYSYLDVEMEVFLGLIAAESVGSYFYHVIRTAYPYTQWSTERELIRNLIANRE